MAICFAFFLSAGELNHELDYNEIITNVPTIQLHCNIENLIRPHPHPKKRIDPMAKKIPNLAQLPSTISVVNSNTTKERLEPAIILVEEFAPGTFTQTIHLQCNKATGGKKRNVSALARASAGSPNRYMKSATFRGTTIAIKTFPLVSIGSRTRSRDEI